MREAEEVGVKTTDTAHICMFSHSGNLDQAWCKVLFRHQGEDDGQGKVSVLVLSPTCSKDITPAKQWFVLGHLCLDPLCLTGKPEGVDGLCAVGQGRRDVGNHDCLAVASQGVLHHHDHSQSEVHYRNSTKAATGDL